MSALARLPFKCVEVISLAWYTVTSLPTAIVASSSRKQTFASVGPWPTANLVIGDFRLEPMVAGRVRRGNYR